MKIRTGFVSNSSSSSFCIYGVDFDIKQLSPDIIHAVCEKWRAEAEEDEKNLPDEEVLDNIGKYEFEDYVGDLEIHGNSDRGYSIGLSWKCIGDDETGAKFKERVQSELVKIGITEAPTTIEDAWYDG